MMKHFETYGTRPRVGVVGAAEGLGKWGPWSMMGLVDGLGFEPDPIEFNNLKSKFPWVHFDQHALGNRTGNHKFYETQNAQCGSCLEPDMEVLSPYSVADRFEIKNVSQVSLTRFDELCDKGTVLTPNFLQVDVQGFEYEVFDGFGKYLDDVVGIECESHFKRLYRSQKTLWELMEYLGGRGFVLRHLEPQGPFGGEYLEMNAYFARLTEPEEAEKRSLIRLWEWVCNLPPVHGKRKGL